MLEERDLFLEFLWEGREIVLLHHVLLFVGGDCLSLVIIKLISSRLGDDLGGVIEEDTRGHIRE